MMKICNLEDWVKVLLIAKESLMSMIVKHALDLIYSYLLQNYRRDSLIKRQIIITMFLLQVVSTLTILRELLQKKEDGFPTKIWQLTKLRITMEHLQKSLSH